MNCAPGHIRIRRDIAANWITAPLGGTLPKLLPGEMGLDTTNNIVKIGKDLGDGKGTIWNDSTIVNNPPQTMPTSIFDGGSPATKYSPSPVLDCGFVS